MRVMTLLLDNFRTRPIDAIFMCSALALLYDDTRHQILIYYFTPLVLKNTVARILNTTIPLSPAKMHCKGYTSWELEFMSVVLVTV